MSSDKRKRNIIHGEGQKIKDLFVIDMQCEKIFLFKNGVLNSLVIPTNKGNEGYGVGFRCD